MTKRQKILDYIKNGGEELICSPQIGCGAGYDAKLLGKEFCSSIPLTDTISICRRYDIYPIYNIGIDPLMHCKEAVWVEDAREETDTTIKAHSHLDTPHGSMHRFYEEHARIGGINREDAVRGPEDLDKFEYLLDMALAETDLSCYTDFARSNRALVGEDGALSIQWCMQPYEMLGYPNTVETAMLPHDDEPRFFRLMDKILALDYKIIDALAGTGVDFVFLGGPGAELLSPTYYEKYLVPYSKKVTDYAHAKGLLIYSHICSPIEPMLTMGYYNQMGIDLFETLSPVPEGNVISLADAMTKLDKNICTRGNVSLSLLMNAEPEEIRQEVLSIAKATQGRKHLVAASDYLLYDIREENVIAMCDAVKEYNAAATGLCDIL